MRKLIILFLAASLAGCASHYGNYTKNPDAYNVKMADDTAKEFAKLYHPASTHLELSQEANDAFGIELLKKLRHKGFAIEESQGEGISTYFNLAEMTTSKPEMKLDPDDPNKEIPVKPAKHGSGKPFGYVVDELTPDLFRVTITIDNKTLSRVYAVSNERIAPAGAWTRKE